MLLCSERWVVQACLPMSLSMPLAEARRPGFIRFPVVIQLKETFGWSLEVWRAAGYAKPLLVRVTGGGRFTFRAVSLPTSSRGTY